MKLGGTEVQWAFVHNLAVSGGDRFKIIIAQADKSIFKNKFVAGLTFFKFPTSINTRTLEVTFGDDSKNRLQDKVCDKS